MNIIRTLSGLIVISEIVNNQLFKEKYSGYTMKQAIKKFREHKMELMK